MNKKNIKVLLVEDFTVTRKLEVRTLHEIGFEHVIESENGQIAVRVLEKNPDIGLVISDWNMPEMDGHELLKWVRGQKEFKTIPFIMATAQGENQLISKARASGANQVITKPFSAEELEDVIAEAFGEARPEVKALEPIPTNPEGKPRLRVAHIQITDHLILGILNHLIATGKAAPKHFELETQCMSSWNPVQKSLEKGEVDAAFMLAPIAMDMFASGAPIRLTLFAHKNGSICVKSREQGAHETLHAFLKSKSFFLPHILSVHHMLSDMFLKESGLTLGPVGKENADVFYEVVPPVKMPEFLDANPNACGFMVAEPLGTKAVFQGVSEVMFLSGELWENHPCCVVVMRKEFMEKFPDAAQEFTDLLVQAGQHMGNALKESAKIAVRFLDPNGVIGLTHSMLENVIGDPRSITTDDLYPVLQDLDIMQRYMVEHIGIGTMIDLEKFVDLKYAKEACKGLACVGRLSTLRNPADIVNVIADRYIHGKPGAVFIVTEDDHAIEIKFSSDISMLSPLDDKLSDFFNKSGIENPTAFKQVVRELLTNALVHGSRNDPSKQITCSVDQVLSSLYKITVTDQGKGFDPYQKETSTEDDYSSGIESGFRLVRSLSDKITFNETGNQVTVYLKVGS